MQQDSPLVVIDPEDRKAVDRLWALVAEAQNAVPHDADDDEVIDATQTALREFANPPKPEEPYGLGAVVEDADGYLWVLLTLDGMTPWKRQDKFGERHRREYVDVAAVRVLSEGWTS